MGDGKKLIRFIADQANQQATRDKIDQVRREVAGLRRQQEEQAYREERRASAEKESDWLASIEIHDALPIELGCRGIIFEDECEEVYLIDAELRDWFKDLLVATPKGEGKYFRWEADVLDDDGTVDVTIWQKTAWLVAKGRDPKRVAHQRRLQAEQEAREKAEREAEREEGSRRYQAEQRRGSFVMWTIIAAVALGVLWMWARNH